MPEAATQGRFVWYDLMTTDPVGAVQFYGSLIGWGTEEWEGADNPYTMWLADDGPIGGVLELPDMAKKSGAPPHWLGYVETKSVDDTVSKAKSRGADVYVQPRDIPTVGRFSVMGDPEGVAFAAFRPEKKQSNSAEQEIGHISWHELMTSDPEKAWDFYSSIFGWSKMDHMDMGEAGIYQMFGTGKGGPVGGIFKRPETKPASAWQFYIKVPDVDEDAKRVKELGGKVTNGPMDIPGGDRIVECVDPQGAAFALHSSKQ